LVEFEAQLAAAHRAFDAREWSTAFEGFAVAAEAGELAVDDLVAMSDAAFWSGRTDIATDLIVRAHGRFVDENRLVDAADAAVVVCRMYATRGDWAVAAGWLERARRDLGDLPECAVHAHVEYAEAYGFLALKDYARAAVGACRVEDIASRFGDRDFVALARAMQGFIAMHTGDVAAGSALLDEALATATAGELGLFPSAEIFCEMVVASLDVADYERAAEWLEEVERSDQIVCFPGCCRVHRTTVLRHRGHWDEARRSAEQARAEVAGIEATHEGIALTEIGELHRYRGELTLAQRAFAEAHEKGFSPQPGLALALFAQAETDGAVRMIERAVEQSAQELAALVALLPAHAEIAIAAGDLATAQTACEALLTVASTLNTSAAGAAAACTKGRVLQRQGDLRGAARELEHGIRVWQEAREPYEAARARAQLGAVLEALGDPASAALERTAARATFERLGATIDAARVSQTLGDKQPQHATAAFMFTDIVNSTPLLAAIGDDAWHNLRRWHDQTATAIFATHHGHVIKHTGDGYFVAFDDTALAVDAAIAFQRALDAHRRNEGFAPSVRIGIHLGNAVINDADYSGRDVVIAARIGALATSDEILISRDAASQLGRHIPVSSTKPHALKGIPEAVDVAAVEWQKTN
jgi:class 3 adenylate cyclase